MLKEFLKSIFNSEKWETIYFTSDALEYSTIKGKLINNNIETRTKVVSSGDRGRGGKWGRESNNNYEILVKESNLHLANEIIHNK